MYLSSEQNIQDFEPSTKGRLLKVIELENEQIFKTLDKLGEVSSSLIFDLLKMIKIKNIDRDKLKGNFNFESPTNVFYLSSAQRQLFDLALHKIQEDTKYIQNEIDGSSIQDLSKKLFSCIYPNGNGGGFELSKTNFRILPGGIAVLIQDVEYFKELQKDPNVFGFYKRKKGNGDVFDGRIVVVDATVENAENVLIHEYLHLLNANYLEEFELPPIWTLEISEIRREIKNIKAEIAEINDKMGFSEFEDLPRLLQELSLKKKKLAILLQKKKKAMASSDYFQTSEAIELFKSIRDELVAYAITGRINTNIKQLVYSGKTFEEALADISDVNDREKLSSQWQKLALTLDTLKETGTKPETLVPVFISSQNFAIMDSRLKRDLI